MVVQVAQGQMAYALSSGWPDMRVALVKNNIVENVIIAEQAFVNLIIKDWQACVDVTDTIVGIGWTYNNDGSFSAPIGDDNAP